MVLIICYFEVGKRQKNLKDISFACFYIYICIHDLQLLKYHTSGNNRLSWVINCVKENDTESN